MTVDVVNKTGGDIQAVTVMHTWNGEASKIGPGPLDDGGGTSFTIKVGGGGADEWYVGFTDGYGNQLYRNGKGCNIEQSDYDSGEGVLIVLGSLNAGWSIELPKSSGCIGNSYSRGLDFS